MMDLSFEVLFNLNKYIKDWDESVEKIKDKTEKAIKKNMQDESPYRTGDLRESIVVGFEDGFDIRVTSDLDYAEIQNFWTDFAEKGYEKTNLQAIVREVMG